MRETSEKLTARAALLDFYADRAAAFASLFVACIFGLVTVLAITQGIDRDLPLAIYSQLVFVSLSCYIGFAWASSYVFKRFNFWATLAETLANDLFEYAKPREIECARARIKGREKLIRFNVYLKFKHEEQKRLLFKRVAKHFGILYLILIFVLAVLVYIPALFRLIN